MILLSLSCLFQKTLNRLRLYTPVSKLLSMGTEVLLWIFLVSSRNSFEFISFHKKNSN
jgi:hypothetical protein